MLRSFDLMIKAIIINKINFNFPDSSILDADSRQQVKREFKCIPDQEYISELNNFCGDVSNCVEPNNRHISEINPIPNIQYFEKTFRVMEESRCSTSSLIIQLKNFY